MKNIYILVFTIFLSNYCYSQIRADFTPHENYNIYQIAIDESGFLHAVERGDENLVYTVFDSMLNPVSDPLIFPNTSNASRPQIGLKSDNVVVVWRQISMSYNSYIYGHLFPLWSDTIESFFQINEVYFDAKRYSPDVCFLNDTTFVTVWCGNGPQIPLSSSGVFSQLITTSLNFIGNNQSINDSLLEDMQSGGSIILCSPEDQSYTILWRDDRSGINKIYGRIFNLEKTIQDSSFLISDGPDISDLWFIDAAITSNGTFVVVWGAEIENKWQIQWRWFFKNGESMGPSETITSNIDSVLIYAAVSVAIDKNNQGVFVWEQNENGYSRIHAQRFLPDQTLLGEPFQVSTLLDTFNQYLPGVVINNNKIYTVWFEGGKTKASIIDFNAPPVTLDDNKSKIKATKYYLSNNYPNPFNSQSTIEFSVFKSSNFRLVIFDNLGREVVTLFNQAANPKKLYQVIWDGKNSHGYDVSSGIYYYQLISRTFMKTKKLILIR